MYVLGTANGSWCDRIWAKHASGDMKLKKLKIVRYRQLKDVEVEFGPLTVLVGPNGCGKSTILRAIDFGLSGETADEVTSTNGRPSLQEQLLLQGMPEVELTVELEVTDARRLDADLKRDVDHDPKWDGGIYTIRRVLHQADHLCATSELVGLNQEEEREKLGGRYEKFGQWLDKYLRKNITVILAERRLGISNRDGQSIQPADGETVLHRMFESANVRDKGRFRNWQRFQSLMNLALPEFNQLHVVQRNGVQDLEFGEFTGFWMGSGHKEIAAVLGEIALTESPVIGVEEPERGIHPGLVSRLFDTLCEACKDRQVVVTTHAPGLVAKLPIESVWAADANGGFSRLTPERAAEVGKALGLRVADVLDHEVLLLVEGESDAAAWSSWLAKAGLSSRCAAVDIGGFGDIKYYANARLLKLRRVKPQVCTALDGDTRSKPGGKDAIRIAQQAAKEYGGVALDLQMEMIEDYLLEEHALAIVLGRDAKFIEGLFQSYRSEWGTKGNRPGFAKWALGRLFHEHRGSGYHPAADAAAIAAAMDPGRWHPDIKAAVKALVGLRGV